MRDYERLKQIVNYCKDFPGWFFEYLAEGINADDDTCLNLLEEYADWSDLDQDGQGFTAWNKND